MSYKVYATHHYYDKGFQASAIVAAKTKKKAMELFGFSSYMFKNYASHTANKKDVKLAMDKPETVIVRERYHDDQFKSR